ncbi:cytochrome c-type biogenesis protein CcmH precursor [Sphingomonas mucosissima]|uniref:Cytochrome c-type biogenesis protein n=2 Tax=Sphingomonas mucosissima TaxID=370959 RepID=A0A245ZGX8_9SPHN|nr:cytochrome c-type biogenesis protein CcmH precursor [Sphingomonas mucosissima]
MIARRRDAALMPLLRQIGCATMAATLALAPPTTAQGRPPADYANVQLPDPAKEAEATALMATLRCLVCQGQAIIDSDADMAGDMRSLVRQRIAAGESANEVRDWLIARYGDYVTYDPPVSPVTLPLWLAPIVLLAFGVWIARASFRRRNR